MPVSRTSHIHYRASLVTGYRPLMTFDQIVLFAIFFCVFAMMLWGR
ncbi:hypothetical protein [Breoghania sp.]